MKPQTKAVIEAALASVKADKTPRAGEVWWVSLNPTKGHEQAGYRPVVVVSPDSFNEATGRFFAVPCTTKEAPTGTHRRNLQVQVADMPEPTFAMPDQMRVLDWRERKAEFRGHRATAAELEAIRERLKVLQGIS